MCFFGKNELNVYYCKNEIAENVLSFIDFKSVIVITSQSM